MTQSSLSLEVRELEVAYGRNRALTGVSLTVTEGACTAVVGANGAGKSSLLRCIAGLVRPRSGSVCLNGLDVTAAPPWRLARLGLRLVPENRELFGSLTVSENLVAGALSLPARLRTDALRDVFNIFPALSELTGRRAGRLSGGEQQMLAIGRALAGRPRLLLLDEPGLGLAPTIVASLAESLRLIAARGVAVVVAEQALKIPLEVANDVLLLRLGREVSRGLPADVLGETQVREAFFGRAATSQGQHV